MRDTNPSPAANAADETESAGTPLDFSDLRKKVKRFEAMQEEIARYVRLDPELRGEIKSITERLGKLGINALELPGAGQEHFSPEVKADLSIMESIRTKLSLLPGCKQRQEQAAASLASSIYQECREIGAGLYQAAKKQMLELQGTLGLEIARYCGGDLVNARDALLFCIDRSNAKDWKDFWEVYRPSPHPHPAPCALLDHLEQYVRQFESGKARQRT